MPAVRPSSRDEKVPPPPPPPPPRQRWRLSVSVPAPTAADTGASSARGWSTILEASGLPLAGHASGRGRTVPAAPLPLGVAGEREVVDAYLAARLPVDVVGPAIVAALPSGWVLVSLHDVWVGAPAAPAAVVGAVYRAVVTGALRREVEAAAVEILAARSLLRRRRRDTASALYDLRPLLLDLEVRSSDADGITLGIRLRHGADAVGRPEEVVAALGEPPAPPLSGPTAIRALVRERLVMADDPDAPAAVPSLEAAESPRPTVPALPTMPAPAAPGRRA